MVRKCQFCGQMVNDDKAILCPSCGTILASDSAILHTLTHEQEENISEMLSERLLNNKRFKRQIVRSILLWIMGVIGLVSIFFGFSIWDSLKRLTASTNARLAAVDLQTSNQIVSTEGNIRTSISQQFNDPRIKGIMTEVAATQATNLLNQQITPEIENFRRGTSNTLAQFDDSLHAFQSQSTNALADVRKANEFVLLVAKALSDDYQSFEQLVKIGNSSDTPFVGPARRTTMAVVSRANEEIVHSQTLGLDLRAMGLKPETDSFENFKGAFFSQAYDALNQVILLNVIFNENRFPKTERLDFVVSMMTNHPSLVVRNDACYLISKEAGINKGIMGMQDLLAWWNANRSKYSNTSTNNP